jgi:hypothetical protein
MSPADADAAQAPDGEVVVRRCLVRVVRRGGWSWGPAPDRLPQKVMDLLPELLAQRFAAELAGDVDVEITEPVTLVLPVSLAGLDRAAGSAALPALAPVPAPGYRPEPVAPVPTGPAVPEPAGPLAGVPLPAGPELAEVLRLLLDPDRSDLLWELLPAEVRAAYRLALATLPDIEPGTPADVPTDSGGTRVTPTVPARRRPRGRAEVEVASALPFLLAAALARIGVLDAIGPVLAGAGLAEDVPLFATALAYKALGPVQRGWLRAPADRTDAAVFAGLDEEVPDDALAGFARRAGPALPMLDGLLGLSLSRGHEPAVPLLLAQVAENHGSGLLLVEPEGLFPIVWVGQAADALPYWRGCGRPPVVLSPGTPSGALVPVATAHAGELAEAGVPLVSGTPPARGERWRRVAGPGRWWIAGPEPTGGYRPVGRIDLTGLTTGLDELVTTMAQRPAIPRAGGGIAFERGMTLTATLALGTLAWLLWRHRERPDPQLTLSRLGDLGGLVRFEAESVRVRLPLGGRYADLRRHGLLADIPHVAWLGNRTLTFTGG